MTTWDFIVIGAGSAGCAATFELASRLPNKRILVIEAGPEDRSPIIKLPAGVWRACAKYDWGYQADPDASRNGMVQDWLRGKVVGGSSSINGTIFVRGAAEDFDRWSRNIGNRGDWSANEVMPIFRDMEVSDQNGSLRGKRGRLCVRTVQKPHELTRAFVASAVSAGLAFNKDYNDLKQSGVSYIQLTQKRGLRFSSADAFMRPALRSGRVKLLTRADVEKIEITNGRARGVHFRHNGKPHFVQAGSVIVSAGAINTPKILMLSGVGDSDHLRTVGVPLVVHLPGVGKNLKDHPNLRLLYSTKIPSYNPTEGLFQKLSIAWKYAAFGEGPIANLFEAIAFAKTNSLVDSTNVQLTFMPVGYDKAPSGAVRIAPYPSFSISVTKSHSASVGEVRLRSANPAAPPIIDIAVLRNRADIESMIDGIKLVRNIMGQKPIKNCISEELMPGPGIVEDDALEEYVRRNTGICYHTIGTCRIGTDSEAVVGPDLRLHGVDNVWIADASIMPDPISSNTNATCIMIGAKLGRQLSAMIAGDDEPVDETDKGLS